jgi:catechol 2,3-dioxygenase-like lactoylglutathione lyase family enzyme
MSEQPTRITGLAAVAVPVTDQDRALTFYTEQLGFEKRRDVPMGPGQRWIEVAPPGSAVTIALAPPPDGGSVGVDTGIRLSTVDADFDHTALGTRGVDVDPEVLHWPGVPPMFVFRDPDGNRLVIVQAV